MICILMYEDYNLSPTVPSYCLYTKPNVPIVLQTSARYISAQSNPVGVAGFNQRDHVSVSLTPVARLNLLR